MTEELINKLLNTKTEDEFMEIITKEKENYFTERKLWDDKVIKHALKLFDLTIEQFEWGFTKELSKDDFNEEEI